MGDKANGSLLGENSKSYGTSGSPTPSPKGGGTRAKEAANRAFFNFFRGISRTKKIDLENVEKTELKRCLTSLDLTALGIGSTLGAGIYVLAGQVARQTAGPSIIISFFIAAVASVLAGLCYAEFGGRIPKTGSAYVYSYYTVGEIWAFIIGWNLILEYTIGTASVARAWSGYFDSLINNVIMNFFRETMPMSLTGLSPYPDFFAFGITLLLSALLSFGVKESSRFNNIFTGVNILVVTYVVICGLFKVNIDNWTIPKDKVPNSTDPRYSNGDGGFLPFGVSGVVSGAATCFYGFVGFDVIATSGEEVNNPQRAIPLSIIMSLFVCFLAYFGVSSVITLMTPYYLLDTNAPLPAVFESVGWGVAKYVIAVGAVCGLSTSLLGAMFPLPRIIYAMASDGVIFKFLASVNSYTQTPLLATIIAGIFSACMALLFDLKELVDMMSIGVLLAYTLVAACVMMLRYKRIEKPDPNKEGPSESLPIPPEGMVTLTRSRTNLLEADSLTAREKLLRVFRPLKVADDLSDLIVKLLTALTALMIIIFCLMIVFSPNQTITILAVIPGVFILVFLVLIWIQPQDLTFKSFKMPLVPLIPVLSMLVNIYLMLKLSEQTWIRFAVWMGIGIAIYLSYGMWHSTERVHRKVQPNSEPSHEFVNPTTGDVEASRKPTFSGTDTSPISAL